MTQYSQRDPRWANEKLGFGSTTIGGYGCKLTSFAMLDGRTPSELNAFFKENGCFSGDLLYDDRCAKALGWGLQPTTHDKPSVTPCIAEVDMSPAPGKQQHFVVWQEGGIIDPWTGQTRSHEMYPEVSFRNFVIPKEETMLKEFVHEVALSCDKKEDFFGDNMTEKEQKDAAKRLKEVREESEANSKKLTKERDDALETARTQTTQVNVLKASLKQCMDASQIPEVPGDIDTYSLTELAGAFFRKLIGTKK